MLRYISRFANLIALLVILQVLFFTALVWGLSQLYHPAGIALIALSAAVSLFVASGEDHPVFRLAWVTAILLLPVLGGMAYIFFHNSKADLLVRRSHSQCLKRALTKQKQSPSPLNGEDVEGFAINKADKASSLIATYLETTVGFAPALAHNAVYFPVGEEKIAYLIDAINKAERYIFLEYFIIEKGLVWDSIYSILKQKAAQGVEVRLICDGAGCMYPLPWTFAKHMERSGIKVRLFNPVRPLVSARFNTRNHRKIAVIDGKVAFCGGLNLADQYANIKQMYGHFKDAGVMVDGFAAWNMALLFLSMWEFAGKGKEKVDYEAFLPVEVSLGECEINAERDSRNSHNSSNSHTVAVPMLDVPKDRFTVSEHTLLSFISRAEEYVYVTTPYLMCGGEILSAMYSAALSGVDVRVITPYVADKKLVKAATESYYRRLLQNKVRVFEYIPGFIHAKNIITDGKRAMVGTVNLDYRSLYLHYECGVCLFGGSVVADIERDFRETLAQCREVTLEDLDKVSWLKRVFQRTARLFAPFL